MIGSESAQTGSWAGEKTVAEPKGIKMPSGAERVGEEGNARVTLVQAGKEK